MSGLPEPRSPAAGPADAWKQALERREPAFLPQERFIDARGWALMNQLREVLRPEGQVNYSLMKPGVIKAWHRHENQTDFWIPVRGMVRAGVHREEDSATWLLDFGEDRPGVLVIPPGLWHGVATLGDGPAGLLYYVTLAYNPAAPDEGRRPEDDIPGFPWRSGSS